MQLFMVSVQTQPALDDFTLKIMAGYLPFAEFPFFIFPHCLDGW
jgi:hypothetical protein